MSTQAVVIDPADLLTAEEVAARLKVRKTWLYEKIRQRKSPHPFPHFRVGKYLRFSWADVSAWVEGTRSAPKKAAR
jgi:excisionase family DNA binding protein